MKDSSNRSLRAFTLLEVVIVLGLFVVIFLALVQFFIHYNTSYSFERAQVGSSSSADAFMGEIQNVVLPADQVLVSHSFGGTTYSSATTTLVLELPSIDSTGAIVSGAYDYVVLYINGTRAYETIAANAASRRVSRTRLLSNTVSDLSFSYDNASFPSVTNVTVSITTSASYGSHSTQSHLREQVYLRNLSS